MEQVLYYLLWIKDKKYIKTLPWPVTTLKEAAEFRNAATVIINVSIYEYIKNKYYASNLFYLLWKRYFNINKIANYYNISYLLITYN